MNIYDIAKAANVAPSTVSRVLNHSESVKQSTRERVMAIINEAGYVPNAMAKNLSIGESKTIAFIVPDIDNRFFSRILHGITDMAMECGYNVFMFDTNENTEREHTVLSTLPAGMIGGLIIAPVMEENRQTKEYLTQYQERGVPVVLIDRDIMGYSFDGIFSEDVNGSAQAVECLINAGHRNIATITGPLTSRPGRARFEGYKRALADHSLPPNPDYIANGGFRVQESYAAMKTLMQARPRPTALFAANNMTTLGCLKYMKEAGMRIGSDISLIGFDDIPELDYTNISLTVVDRPVYEMGRDAMSLLKMRFRGEDRNIVHRHLVKTRLILRGSENKD